MNMTKVHTRREGARVKKHAHRVTNSDVHAARKVAIDAFLEGRIAKGEHVLDVERARLTKPQLEWVVGRLSEQGRDSDASAVIAMHQDSLSTSKSTPTKTSQAVIDALAKRTEDAYSFPRYASWKACAAALLRRGYTEQVAEEILYSTVMRWAADSSLNVRRATANDLLRCIDRNHAWVRQEFGDPRERTA